MARKFGKRHKSIDLRSWRNPKCDNPKKSTPRQRKKSWKQPEEALLPIGRNRLLDSPLQKCCTCFQNSHNRLWAVLSPSPLPVNTEFLSVFKTLAFLHNKRKLYITIALIWGLLSLLQDGAGLHRELTIWWEVWKFQPIPPHFREGERLKIEFNYKCRMI